MYQITSNNNIIICEYEKKISEYATGVFFFLIFKLTPKIIISEQVKITMKMVKKLISCFNNSRENRKMALLVPNNYKMIFM